VSVPCQCSFDALEAAAYFLTVSEEARFFVEKYMKQIVGRLVDLEPSVMSKHERSCVHSSLRLATTIIARDLEIQLSRRGQSKLLEVLSLVFDRDKHFYYRGDWYNQASGLPEVRMRVINVFLRRNGFALLSTYMMERMGSPVFPDVDILHQVLSALGDLILESRTVSRTVHDTENVAIDVGQATMVFMSSCFGEELKEVMQILRVRLSRIFDRLITSRRDATYEYYKFWRDLVLRLIKSPSLPVRLFGWQEIDDLLDACVRHRPPPRFFDITDAGCTFVNGRYTYIAATNPDGYTPGDIDVSYQRHIPENETNGGGKKLTLSRCRMISDRVFWFLSEADEEQPGTDRDIDYYQHKSTREQDKSLPPRDCWISCRSAGIDPPPMLRPMGVMTPAGEEYNTLEHQLAEWAVKNGIIHIVLGDSVYREIAERSLGLIKFLGSMCHRDNDVDSTSTKAPNKYCLRVEDLLDAWKGCPRKADPAVSAQVYQLMLCILSGCPGTLATPLLEAIDATLHQDEEDRGRSIPLVALHEAEDADDDADACSSYAGTRTTTAPDASDIVMSTDKLISKKAEHSPLHLELKQQQMDSNDCRRKAADSQSVALGREIKSLNAKKRKLEIEKVMHQTESKRN